MENAIRHGVRSRKEGVVRVAAYREGNEHLIVIEDNGTGFTQLPAKSEDGTHIGIKNVRERLEQMCNGTMTIDTRMIKSADEASVTESDIYDIIEDMTEEGTINEEQSELISSALQFGDVTVESILTSRMDVAAIDIDMPQMNGITLAAQIKKIKPDTIILFLTAYKKFAFDAFQVHPNGYLLKPLELQVLQKEIDYAISLHPQTAVPHIEAHTFGNFDLLVDGVTVQFKRS